MAEPKSHRHVRAAETPGGQGSASQGDDAGDAHEEGDRKDSTQEDVSAERSFTDALRDMPFFPEDSDLFDLR